MNHNAMFSRLMSNLPRAAFAIAVAFGSGSMACDSSDDSSGSGGTAGAEAGSSGASGAEGNADAGDGGECAPGKRGCPCAEGDLCAPGLSCQSGGVCLPGEGSEGGDGPMGGECLENLDCNEGTLCKNGYCVEAGSTNYIVHVTAFTPDDCSQIGNGATSFEYYHGGEYVDLSPESGCPGSWPNFDLVYDPSKAFKVDFWAFQSNDWRHVTTMCFEEGGECGPIREDLLLTGQFTGETADGLYTMSLEFIPEG